MSTGFYRLDLDKTYLATPLEHKLQLVKLPFEGPEAKRTLPGMNTLVRSLKDQPAKLVKRSHVTILSASPQFMANTLQAKMKLDNVQIDRFVFKDQWAAIKRGRFKEISDPLAYKFHALCDLGQAVRENDFEVLVGDDYDMDPIIYSLYANMRAQRISPDILHGYLDRHQVTNRIRDAIWGYLDKMPKQSTVRRIFIRRVKKPDPIYYEAFGTLVKSYEDAFQLILLMFDDGCVDHTAIEHVAAALKKRRWRKTAFAFSWRGLIEHHFLERYKDIRRIIEKLDLVPKRTVLERLTSGTTPKRPSAKPADWKTIVSWGHRPST